MSQKWYLNEISNYDLDGVGSTVAIGRSKAWLESEAKRMNDSNPLDAEYYYIVSDKPMENGKYLETGGIK